MTEQQIKQQYEQKHGRPMSQGDYEAFLKLTAMLGVTTYVSYVDAQEQVIQAIASRFNVAAKYPESEYIN
jgi:hypothetical protein